jgi:hypothetical protein
MELLLRTSPIGKWQSVEAFSYGDESKLRDLLFDHPTLIPMEEIRAGSAEIVFALKEFPLNIGSVDLLGFSASGDIVIIECKLAKNAESKRKVIGQVLEYGANLHGLTYKDIDQQVQKHGKNLISCMKEVIEDPLWKEEEFKQNIEDALKKGDFLLIIVVDEINEYLSRIVNYISEAGQPAFSLAALEMKRLKHGEVEILIPNVYGALKKPSTPDSERTKWNEDTFLQDVKEKITDKDIQNLIENLYQWSKENAQKISFGTGSAAASYVFRLKPSSSIFTISAKCEFVVNFGYMGKAYTGEQIMRFRQELGQIPTFKRVLELGGEDYAYISIKDIAKHPEDLDKFKEAVLRLKSL